MKTLTRSLLSLAGLILAQLSFAQPVQSSCYNDTEPPVAICDGHTVVALGSDGKATLYASVLDDGSYDNCQIKQFKVARMNPGWCPHGVVDDTQFRSFVQFCCEDIGPPIMVIFRVIDKAGNFNDCMVEVTVQDKLPPSIHCPYDKTISCNTHINEHELYDPYSPYYGSATAFDNCGLEGIHVNVIGNTQCGQGKIKRVFTAVDWGGQMKSCTQHIWIVDSNPFGRYDIKFPKDYEADGCGYVNTDPDFLPPGFDRPTWHNDKCAMVAAAYEDLVFKFVDDVCIKILRTWTVIDWCQYDPYKPYSNKGIWTHVQVIKLIDKNKPQFENCKDTTIQGFEPNCAGRVKLDPQVWDICTPRDKLNYEYKIDIDKNGSIDIRREGKQIVDEVLPVGTHKVLWFVDDGCGNLATCSFHVTVVDGKAPTPVCFAQLSTVVMPVGGMVTLWARDFDASSFDNCTPANKLKFSFSPDVTEQSFNFTCDEVGVNNLRIYVTDESNNQAFCNVWLDIGDNQDVCMSMNELTGSVSTLSGLAVSGASVELYKMISDDEVEMDRADETHLDGSYLTGFGTTRYDRMIGATKQGDPLEGISMLDLMMIHQHITGVNSITDPAMLFAADVDQSGHVGVSDLLMLRDAFLSNGRSLAGQDLPWTFYPMDCDWSEESFAPDCPKMVEIDHTAPPQSPIDFIGVKKGDVNGDMLTELTGHRADRRIEVAVEKTTFGSRLHFVASEDFRAAAMQVSMRSKLFGSGNQHNVELIDGIVKLSGGSFRFAENGKLNAAWLSGSEIAINSGDVLFSIDIAHSRGLDITKSVKFFGDFGNIAFTMQQFASRLDIQWATDQSIVRTAPIDGVGEQNEDITSPGVAHFANVEVVPNPVSDQAMIYFESDITGPVELQVMGSDMRLMASQQLDAVRGTNMFVVQASQLAGPGIYYFRITDGQRMSSGKFVCLN